MKSAIVTLAIGNYIVGANVLFYSVLCNLASKDIDLICISDNSYDHTLLKKMGVSIIELESIDSLYEGIALSQQFRLTLRKLEIFRISSIAGYDRIIYLDADTLVRKSIVSLLSKDLSSYALCAVRDYACFIYHPNSLKQSQLKPTRVFNSGLLVVNPNQFPFDLNYIVDRIKEGSHSYDGGDQGYLNSFTHRFLHPEKIGFLDVRYNYAMDPYYPPLRDSEVIINHFTGVKPWNASPASFGAGRDSYLAWFYTYHLLMKNI